MPINYFIESTDGTLSFAINQGEKDGVGGTQRNTDLTLHGFGILQWGESVNEDVLRVMESWACPRKILGDYNPATGDFDYDPAVDPLLPKSEEDFGSPGKGINVPNTGQLWYDKLTEHLHVYNNAGEWNLVSGSAPIIAPSAPDLGDMWYDVIGGQLMIWNGLSWESVATQYVRLDGVGAMTGLLTLSGDPVNPLHAATMQYVDDQVAGAQYVEKAGDTMTGILTLSGDPTNPLEAVTKQYVDNSEEFVNVAGDIMTGNLVMLGANINIVEPTNDNYGITIRTDGTGASQIRMGSQNLANTVVTRPPMIEMFNNENQGIKGTWGWTRITQRDADILTIEADLDPETGAVTGPNTRECLSIQQDGVLTYNGIGAGGLNVVYCPDQTIADTNVNPRVLTTKEYVDSAVGAVPSGAIFISPITLTTSLNSGWQTYDLDWLGAGSYSNAIVQVIGGRNEGVAAELWLRAVGGSTYQGGYIGTYVGGGHDGANATSNQTICPVNGNNQFQYRTLNYNSVTVKLIGYFT